MLAHNGGRTNRFFALISVACSRLSVSGGLKKRAGDEWGLLGKKERSGVLTIYTGKPEIPIGKSNGSRHSVWEASDNMGCNMR